MRIRAAILVTLIAASAVSLAARRQDQMDMELRMKWALAELIHYDVVAEYSAKTPVLAGYKTAVTDRFEVSFDYFPQKASFADKPVFKNNVSTVSKDFEGAACMHLEALGAYEHLDTVAVKAGLGVLEMTIKRSFPAGRIPRQNEVSGECEFRTSAAKVETLTHLIPMIPGTFFATPGIDVGALRIGEPASGANKTTVGKDGKTMVVVAQSGWKYTYTVTLVK